MNSMYQKLSTLVNINECDALTQVYSEANVIIALDKDSIVIFQTDNGILFEVNKTKLIKK